MLELFACGGRMIHYGMPEATTNNAAVGMLLGRCEKLPNRPTTCPL